MVMDDVSNIYEGLNGLQQLLHYFQRMSFEPLLKEQSCMVMQYPTTFIDCENILLSAALWDAAEGSRKSNSKFIRWQTNWLLRIPSILRIGSNGK
jgi:hypothetical protein